MYPYAASKALAELIVTAAPGELDFTLVRLPRVLGEAGQLSRSADILVSIVDACIALHAFPSVTLTEEVTICRPSRGPSDHTARNSARSGAFRCPGID
ncbi:cyclic synthetase [Mycobacteroides abscessus subsp. abscessus]|nr:cyclic synthetase [Mycobacteroides abscessus subsp. abscessus]